MSKENLNLVEILKDCPKGTKLYSTIYSDVELVRVYLDDDAYTIEIKIGEGSDMVCITNDGRLLGDFPGECTLFPSKEQRDWSKFKIKKPKFDPKTLQAFDKVLAFFDGMWMCNLYSHYSDSRYICVGARVGRVIPYNEETKHLVGTDNEAPEFYRYWED